MGFKYEFRELSLQYVVELHLCFWNEPVQRIPVTNLCCICSEVYAIGSSGGALAGGLLFVPELSLDDIVQFIGDCCDDCRSSIWNRFKVGPHSPFSPTAHARLHAAGSVAHTKIQQYS